VVALSSHAGFPRYGCGIQNKVTQFLRRQ